LCVSSGNIATGVLKAVLSHTNSVHIMRELIRRQFSVSLCRFSSRADWLYAVQTRTWRG